LSRLFNQSRVHQGLRFRVAPIKEEGPSPEGHCVGLLMDVRLPDGGPRALSRSTVRICDAVAQELRTNCRCASRLLSNGDTDVLSVVKCSIRVVRNVCITADSDCAAQVRMTLISAGQLVVVRDACDGSAVSAPARAPGPPRARYWAKQTGGRDVELMATFIKLLKAPGRSPLLINPSPPRRVDQSSQPRTSGITSTAACSSRPAPFRSRAFYSFTCPR